MKEEKSLLNWLTDLYTWLYDRKSITLVIYCDQVGDRLLFIYASHKHATHSTNTVLKSLGPIDRKFHEQGENDGFVLYEYKIKQCSSFCK